MIFYRVLSLLLTIAGCGVNCCLAGVPEYPAGLAAYRKVSVRAQPAVPAYRVALGLANVTNRKQFPGLEPATIRLLEANAFAVVPDAYDEFFPVYEQNRYAYIPSFITTDALLHNYHLLFSHLLRQVERKHLAPDLKALVGSLQTQALAQQRALAGTPWANAAARNVGFLTVAARLLDKTVPLPPQVRPEVVKELALIEAHQGIVPSPVMNRGMLEPGLSPLREDYTQYIPRGHYDRDPGLRAYFRAMMWLGRATFRTVSPDETRSALLLTVLLARATADASRWERIYTPTAFFVGRADDLSVPEYEALMRRVYGGVPSGALLRDEGRFAVFRTEAAKLAPPRINSIPIFHAGIDPNREEITRGFRLMGQRYTVDAAIFQQLIYRAVGNKQGNLEPSGARYLPKGLDLPAALGSAEAYRILTGEGETRYYRYPENMEKLRAYLAGLPESQWTQNLYWGWLYSLRPLLPEKGAGYPSFMRNAAWTRKGLNTFLGSWAELKHDTILYAKQVMAEMGGAPPQQRDERGYVEPEPELYARLAALTDMTRRGLESRKLISTQDSQTLRRMEETSRRLQSIAEQELRNAPLSSADYDFIKFFGGNLEHFWLDALRDEGVTDSSQLYNHPAPVIADVATDPNGTVLEVGVGRIDDIYAIVPIAGTLRLARGGVFSYYEFPHPMSKRLTDSQWRQMLDGRTPPARPAWERSFLGPLPGN